MYQELYLEKAKAFLSLQCCSKYHQGYQQDTYLQRGIY